MSKPPAPTRRAFLKRTAVGLLATGAGLGGYAWLIEPHWVEVVRRDLPIRFLPEALDGKTLVQISDLHIGPEVSDAYLRDCFRTVAAIGPDVLIVTGDFMTCLPTRSWITSAACWTTCAPAAWRRSASSAITTTPSLTTTRRSPTS